MSELLGRDAILGAVDVQYQEVDVPEWGGKVRIKGLTAGERDTFEASILQGKGKNTSVNHKNMRAKLLAMSIVDAEGNRIFGNDDIAALGKKSSKAINRLFDIATELNGIGEDDVEELAGNSEADRSDDSSSG